MSRSWRLFLLVGVVFVYYDSIATHGTHRYDLQKIHRGKYNHLTNAILAGRLDVPVVIPPELAADPYNFSAHGDLIFALRLLDYSYYQGKVYVFNGITPVLTLYAPYRILSNGLRLPDRLAALVFCFGGFLWAAALFLDVRSRYFPETPESMALTVCAVLGFANVAPFLIQASRVYELAIAAGVFFLTGGAYWLVSSFRGGGVSSGRLLWAGLFMGLALGCRAHFLLPSGVFLLFAARRLRLRQLLHLAAPFAACVALLLLYNWARFGDVLEFGQHYQLSLINDHQGQKLFGWTNFLAGLYFFTLLPFSISSTYPYAHLSPPAAPAFLRLPADGTYGLEISAGALTAIPFLALLLAGPLLLGSLRLRRSGFAGDSRPERHKVVFPRFEFGATTLAGASILVFLSFYRYISMRYLADYATLLILASGWIWLFMDGRLRQEAGWLRSGWRLSGCLLAAASIAFGIAFAIRGYPYDG